VSNDNEYKYFNQKNCYKALRKYGLNPGSGKNPSRIPDPDPGVKKAPDPGSGSATLK
jgi:hypothetical protein